MTIQRLAKPVALLALCLLTPFASAAELKTLRVAHDFWVGYAGFYAAVAKGFFKDEGLKIDEKTFSTPADGLPALLSGEVDVHLSTLDTFVTALDREAGSVRIISLIDSSAGADAVIAKKSIADLPALKGKTIGVSLGQANHMLLLKALSGKGMTVADVKLVNLNGDDAGNAFAAGKIDAAVTWEPFITQGLKRGGHVLYSTTNAPDFIINAVGVKPGTLTSKRAEVLAFLKAFSRGTAWVQAHKAEAAAIVGKALEQKPKDVLDMMSKDRLYQRADSLALMGTPEKPGALAATVQHIATFLADNKIILKPASIEGFMDASLLQEAR